MSSTVVGPRQGGPISVAYLGDSNVYHYDDAEKNSLYDAFTGNERITLRALIACACLLLLVTVSVFVMTMLRSWLKSNGRRNKSRLTLFVSCLFCLAVARATLVAELVARLQGPAGSTRLFYYDNYGFLVRHILIRFFSWLSDILIFCLVLLEITETNGKIRKQGWMLKYFNFGVIFVLFVLGVAAVGLDARWTMHEWAEDYMATMSWSGLRGTSMVYAVIALSFAVEMLVLSFTQSFPKNQATLLTAFCVTLCLGRALDLINTAVQNFASSQMAYTSILALYATVEFVWIAKVLLMALLAWNSFRAIRSEINMSKGNSLAVRSDVDGSF